MFRITHVKGALEVGRDADVVLMRRDPYRYSAAASGNNFVSWSPYDGIELPFKAVATFVRGQCVAADGRVMADPRHRPLCQSVTYAIKTGREPGEGRVRMAKSNLPLDADRLWADVMELAEITDPARPYTRRSFTALFLEGRAWLAQRFAEAGLTTRIDTAGNLIGAGSRGAGLNWA